MSAAIPAHAGRPVAELRAGAVRVRNAGTSYWTTSEWAESFHARSVEDAVAEWLDSGGSAESAPRGAQGQTVRPGPLDAFQRVWGSINGAESWTANPWVWVVTFARVDSIPDGAKARPIPFSTPMVRAILGGA